MKKIRLFMSLIVFVCGYIILVPSDVYADTVSNETDLREALEGGKSVSLANDIKVTKKSTTTDTNPTKRTVGVAIRGEGVIVIDGNGHSISSDNLNVLFEIYANSGKKLEVRFVDVTIMCKDRCIDTRTAGITLILENSKLITTGSGNTQALTIGGPEGTINVTIKNSEITGGEAGYGIITFNPVNLDIIDSTITGYGAIYMREASNSQGSAGSVVNITNSNIISKSKYSGESNNFGTIVLTDDNIIINVVDSKIEANNTGDAIQVPFIENPIVETGDDTKENVVNINGDSEIIINTNNANKDIAYGSNFDINISGGVVSNVLIDSEFLLEGLTVTKDNNGNYIVGKLHTITLIEPSNGTLNADKLEAFTGETVTLTIKANDGYQLQEIKVVDLITNREIEVNDESFIMPDSDVTIEVSFTEIIVNFENTDINPKTGDNILLYIIFSIGSIIGFIGTGLYIIKREY